MNIVTAGSDLARHVFALHGADQSGKATFIKPKVVRGQLLEMVANLPPCLVGMEACSGAHHALAVPFILRQENSVNQPLPRKTP